MMNAKKMIAIADGYNKNLEIRAKKSDSFQDTLNAIEEKVFTVANKGEYSTSYHLDDAFLRFKYDGNAMFNEQDFAIMLSEELEINGYSVLITPGYNLIIVWTEEE